ncbi:hypothetical protein [Phenylobacterium sp.]|uniref:hypothetical protein n=1 Tax=Phenylobacterium sp. TaxID=1871053 RepID=UPI002FCC95B5
MADGDAPVPIDRPAPAGELSDKQVKVIFELLDRTERSYGRFKLELIAYNVCCVAALALTVYSAIRTAGDTPDAVAMGVYLTSGGLFTVTGARITKFLNDDLKTIREIITEIMKRGR